LSIGTGAVRFRVFAITLPWGNIPDK